MKKTLALFLLLTSLFAFSQGTRIMYEYKFASNIEKKDSMDTELMYLDIKKDGSKFYGRKKFVSDSTRDAYIQKQLSTGSKSVSFTESNTGKVAYSVSKKYPDFATVLHTSLGNSRFAIKNDSPMNWKIASDKKMIEKFEVQKATVDFGGRQWTAWFTQDIPFQDGPYKFHGLPGLILEMEDSTGTHLYKFVGNKNFDEVEKIENKDEIGSTKSGFVVKTVGFGSKEIELTEDQFKKQWNTYKTDPVKDMRQMLSGAGGNNFKLSMNIDGKMLTDNAEILRAMEKNEKEQMKKDNNKIEPALYP